MIKENSIIFKSAEQRKLISKPFTHIIYIIINRQHIYLTKDLQPEYVNNFNYSIIKTKINNKNSQKLVQALHKGR